MAQSPLTACGAGVLGLRSKDEPSWSPPSLISFKIRKKRIVPTIVQFSMSLSEPSLNKPKRARKPTKRDIELKAMRHVWQQGPVDMIRARLALPMHQRTHFPCKRLANGGSTL